MSLSGEHRLTGSSNGRVAKVQWAFLILACVFLCTPWFRFSLIWFGSTDLGHSALGSWRECEDREAFGQPIDRMMKEEPGVLIGTLRIAAVFLVLYSVATFLAPPIRQQSSPEARTHEPTSAPQWSSSPHVDAFFAVPFLNFGLWMGLWLLLRGLAVVALTAGALNRGYLHHTSSLAELALILGWFFAPPLILMAGGSALETASMRRIRHSPLQSRRTGLSESAVGVLRPLTHLVRAYSRHPILTSLVLCSSAVLAGLVVVLLAGPFGSALGSALPTPDAAPTWAEQQWFDSRFLSVSVGALIVATLWAAFNVCRDWSRHRWLGCAGLTLVALMLSVRTLTLFPLTRQHNPAALLVVSRLGALVSPFLPLAGMVMLDAMARLATEGPSGRGGNGCPQALGRWVVVFAPGAVLLLGALPLSNLRVQDFGLIAYLGLALALVSILVTAGMLCAERARERPDETTQTALVPSFAAGVATAAAYGALILGLEQGGPLPPPDPIACFLIAASISFIPSLLIRWSRHE